MTEPIITYIFIITSISYLLLLYNFNKILNQLDTIQHRVDRINDRINR